MKSGFSIVFPLVIFAADLFEGGEALEGGLVSPVVPFFGLVFHGGDGDGVDDFFCRVHGWSWGLIVAS